MAARRRLLGPEDPPGSAVLEISVFGRGVGEALVVHAGDGRWFVVDSFRVAEARGKPIALLYLEQLGVPATAVDLVVATHWDDDHIRGAAATLAACPGARFCCSDALRREDVIAFLLAHEQRTVGGPFSSGTREMVRCLETTRSRNVRPLWATQDRLLLRIGRLALHALAPSDALLEKNRLAVLAPEPEDPTVGTAVRQATPNQSSVVLWAEGEHHRALLGADLEASVARDVGWLAVVDSQTPAGSTAAVFKVPHHGSDDADEPEVWSSLLRPNPHAVLTTYSRARRPREDDLQRLLARAESVDVAGRPAPRRHYEPLVRRMVQTATRNGIRPLSGPVGQVRLRVDLADANADWEVRRFGNAFRAEELLEAAA